jgi:peptidoglycan biosynthesis protein MviN/MurJ (putative lipid II flippase)
MGIFLIILAVLTVAGILGAGLYTLWVGGQLSKDWSNRLMRYRVIAQFVAICIIMLVAYMTAKH